MDPVRALLWVLRMQRPVRNSPCSLAVYHAVGKINTYTKKPLKVYRRIKRVRCGIQLPRSECQFYHLLALGLG